MLRPRLVLAFVPPDPLPSERPPEVCPRRRPEDNACDCCELYGCVNEYCNNPLYLDESECWACGTDQPADDET